MLEEGEKDEGRVFISTNFFTCMLNSFNISNMKFIRQCLMNLIISIFM